jgi:hypothetical protein
MVSTGVGGEGGSALRKQDPWPAARVLEEADQHRGVDLGGGRALTFRGDGICGGGGRGAH